VICGERVALNTALDRGAAMVQADPRQITQVLLNLAADASTAMRGSGRLMVRTADADLIWTGPGSAPLPSGRYVVLELRDSRETPAPAALDTIFEPFLGVDDRSGLRLPVAYALVTQNDGYLTADAAPEGGLVFRVYLPRRQGPATPAPDTGGNGEPAPPV
jgi:signal transduction histidine kinase